MEDGDENPFLSDGDTLPSSSAPTKKPFARPGSRFQPKVLRAPKPEPSLDPFPTRPEVPRDEKPPQIAPPVEKIEAVSLDPDAAPHIEKADEAEPMDVDADKAEPMDVDDHKAEDEIVREIDAFFNPSLEDASQLFLIQYPLRPSWRPYELDGRCRKVRMNPKRTELEFGLSVDVCSENYDNNAEEHLKTPMQMLSGSKAPFVTSYAVGILKGSELYMHPIGAAVQLRPLFKRVANSDIKDGSEITASKTQVSTLISKGKQKLEKTNANEDPGETEDWISIDFHPSGSQLSSAHREKLLAEENKEIQFSMNPHDYVTNLCPGAANGNQNKGPLKRLLLSMPVDERLKIWFTQGGHVHRFAALLHLSDKESTEDFLQLLPKYAHLVQGLWISKSSLFYEGREAAFRDCILLRFSKRITISQEIVPTDLVNVMSQLARKRDRFKDWKLLETPDSAFIKCHPDVVSEQENIWASRENEIMNAFAAMGRGGHTGRRDRSNLWNANGLTGNKNVDASSSKSKVLNEKSNTAISDQAREALQKAIPKVFEKHKVCRINTISQYLRDMALSKLQLQKSDSSAIIAATVGFIDRPDVLKEIISQVAAVIHDVYVLKSVGNLSIDPFRNVVIDLLRVNKRDTKLKKEQIVAAAKSKLNIDISDRDYRMVMSELCDNKGGGWVLKTGDGKPG